MIPSSSTAFAEARRQTWLGRLAAVAVLAALAIAVWLAATYHTTVLKKEAPVSMLMPVQAPPPPPPPPKEQQPQETATPLDQPITPQPQAAKDNAITQNADAQIGGDAYGIGSGSGEGLRGAGVAGMLSRGPYALYMAKTIGRQVEADQAFAGKLSQISIRVWISPAGKITRVALASSTGSDATDQALERFLTALPPFEQAPPQSILDSLPVEMIVKLHRS